MQKVFIMEENISKEMKRRNYLPLYLSAAMAIGLVIGVFLIPNRTKTLVSYHTNEKLGEVVELIKQYYFEEVDLDKVNDDVIQSLLLTLDPHSSYISRKNSQRYDEMLTGQFEGIGIQFNILNDTVLVVNVVPEGPSQKVGLLAGDKIIKVDGKSIAGIKIQNEDVITKLRGKKGSKVKVSVLRSSVNKVIDYEIIRDKIPVESINVAYMLDNKTGYILIDNFSITTGDEFVRAMQNLKEQNMQRLILDLRGNPGGFLGAAIDICDQFLHNDELIVYTQGKHVGKEEYKATDRGVFQDENQKLVVLVDEWSASASEIVAGAVQDHDRGTIIGRRSFGKGLVQRQFYLSDSSEVMLTIARYYTPSGRCIQRPFNTTSIEDYYEDILRRYEKGEMENVDSVKFIDSLKFKTDNGRTVYGGGGIMPDIYIPIKKSDDIVYFNKIVNQGILFTFAMEYVDRNRKQLNRYTSIDDFTEQFFITDDMLKPIIQEGEKQGISSKELTMYSKQKIKIWTKAYIARNLFNTVGFYRIINQEDEMIQKAVSILESKK